MPHHTTPPPASEDILLSHIQRMKKHLAHLRRQLYPILSQWPKHNLTSDDNFNGFVRLDMLRDELDQLGALFGDPVDE